MKYFINILILISSIAISKAENLQMLADSAEQYYSQNNYNLSIENYEKIIANGKESAALYYNLGNAYYKIKNIPLAITNYERALRLSPNDEDVLFNLKLSKSQTVDKIESLPALFFDEWYTAFTNLFSSNVWAYTSIFTFLISLLLLLGFLFSRQVLIKKLSFYFASLLLFVSMVSMSSSYHQKQISFEEQYAIITNPSVNIKSSPDENSTSLFILHSGTKLQIMDKIQTWYKIKIENGNTGWIKDEDLTKI